MVQFVFNHVLLFDDETEEYKVYHKKDKRIPKTVDCYGPSCIAKGLTADEAIDSAVLCGVYRHDIEPCGGGLID